MKLLLLKYFPYFSGVSGSFFYFCLSDIGAIYIEGVIFLFGFCFEVYQRSGDQVQPPALPCDFGPFAHCFWFDICVVLISFYEQIASSYPEFGNFDCPGLMDLCHAKLSGF